MLTSKTFTPEEFKAEAGDAAFWCGTIAITEAEARTVRDLVLALGPSRIEVQQDRIDDILPLYRGITLYLPQPTPIHELLQLATIGRRPAERSYYRIDLSTSEEVIYIRWPLA